MTESAPATLDYAQQPSRLRRWRRRIVRMLTIVSVLVALAAGWHYRRPVALRAAQLYWSRRCMAFSAPRDTKLVEHDPMIAAALRTRDPNYTPSDVGAGRSGAKFDPRCWREYCTTLVPPPALPLLVMDEGCVFLHERRSPGGNRRLVEVECASANARTLPRAIFARIVTPAGIFTTPQVIGFRGSAGTWSGIYIPVRFFFGQPDPADASHFTIDFAVLDGFDGPPIRHGTIDGYLNDDDTVSFRLRDPATTRGFD